MYSVFKVAEAFLTIASMTNKKLQKLCYYAQGWNLGITGEKLFNERIEAWVHGPVCPELYDRYKGYGYNNIPKNEEKKEICPELMELVTQIYRIYGQLDGNQLEVETHKERPWIEARNGNEPWEASHEEITIESMQSFFRELYEEVE